MPMRTSRVVAATATVLLFSLTACGGGGGSDNASSADAASAAGGGAGAQREAADAAAAPAASQAKNAADLVEQQAVIKNGAVSLRSDDVGQTRFDVQALVDQHNGQVSEDQTETDKTGQPLRSRMVIRVPSEDFDEVMDALSKLKLTQLASLTSSAEDVTTQVIDVQARIDVQQRSVDRVSELLGRAQSIRDIMRIESELSRRQADLDSLKQQQAYLADQTTLATIRVSIERKPNAIPVEKKEAHTGFLAGLESGWHGLKATLVAVLTIVGAVLPFALVALLFGVPAWLLIRRTRRTSEPALASRVPDNAS
jgi:hypothetical protein